MGTTAFDSEQQYSCKCLNIRFRPSTIQTVATELETDPDFTQLFVGDEGIVVTHPQVTVRTRTQGVPIAGTSRCSRFTTITCLVCDLIAYRVYQTYSTDVEGKDGPLLPTEDWVERDVLKSSNGWIEVHKQCMTRDAISQALLSPHYSTVFHLLLPSSASPPPASSEHEESLSPLSPASSFPKSHFGHLRPVFLPPPFTPSHAAFAYLSSIVTNHAEAVRSAAEQHINDLIQNKASEIEHGDAELRRNVEALWQKFREGLARIQEQSPPVVRRSPASRSSDATRAVRDFVPAAVSPARSPSPPAPRISALSVSLATSSFHHPRAQTDHGSQLPDRPSSAASNQSNGSTSSLTLILPQGESSDGPNGNVLKFKRNINDTINTAASYRYFINLEEEVIRQHRVQNERKQEPDQNQAGGSSEIAESSNDAQKQKKQSSRSDADETTISRGREKAKGKRKVTFDVEPAVVTIKREVNAEKEDDNDADQDPREMIFELEDLDQEANESLVGLKSSLPLLEQPSQPTRTRKHRHSTDLSESFSTLRPASLPAPSHIRPPKNSHGVNSSFPAIIISLPRPSSSPEEDQSSGSQPTSPTNQPGEKQRLVNPRDTEILKLVAANMPSHRGAWQPNSKAWQTFVRRQDSRDHAENGYISEEGEEENNGDGPGSAMVRDSSDSTDDDDGGAPNGSDQPFIGSLPIPIKLPKRPQVLSLASYRPQVSIPEQPVVNTAPNVSTTALRKAAYAERDRSRSVDPGALDFEEEEEEKDHRVVDDATDAGDRGRNRALKILQAGSEVPEAGMWRSLAT